MSDVRVLAESSTHVPRKIVGRPPSLRKVLWQLEEMARFVTKFTHGKPAIIEGDYFPVRKAVGRLARAGIDFAVVGGVVAGERQTGCLGDAGNHRSGTVLMREFESNGSTGIAPHAYRSMR